jgi:hypothetical protein
VRILVTGAHGNIGRGLAPLLGAAGHQLVLADLPGFDVRVEGALDTAAEGCDLVLHLPAWHGIHSGIRTETEFWRLNVDGTFNVLQSAARAGVSRVVFLSSQSWHDHYGKYGFTKRVGEELLEYHRHEHGLSYVSVRPGNLTPWGDDWPGAYGRGLLYGRVDRDDVLAAIVSSVDHLGSHDAGLVVDAVRANPDDLDRLQGWAVDPVGTAEALYPGAREVVERFALDIAATPAVTGSAGWAELGYRPTRDFGTFVTEALGMTAAQARALRCPY